MGRIYKRPGSDCWFADYVNEKGKRVRKSTKWKDRRKAQQQLSAWENDAREIRGGLKVARVVIPIAAALDEYQRASTKSADYVAYTRLQIERIVQDQLWCNLEDITAEGLEAFIEGLDGSARTKHSHITALRIFCRWCVRRGKLPADPTANVEKPSLDESSRRMLERSEWELLRKYLSETGVVLNGQEPHDRLMMYWLAVETGLRSKEILSLTRASIVLNVDEPHVLCKGVDTKNKTRAQQFISDALAKELANYVSNKLPAAKVFTVNSNTRMAQRFREDCEAAGIENTEVLDFHCLRHTTGSWLAAAGIPLHEVQRIMRHSTIQLTIDRYGHLAKNSESRNRNILGSMLA